MLLTRAYHEDRGEHRTKVLTPDTAHGTNPATVTMAGYEVVKVGTDERGGVDVEDLRAKADENVACLMLTNPNTLGLFDENIEEIAKIVHGVGATLYYDGANLNAVMGRTRPGDMGFDIVHYNLHKTFTQPHGGGGPGAGPIAVSDRIEPYLTRPQVVRREEDNGHGPSFDLDYDRPKSIGRLRGFQGNYGVFVRSYAYILSLGGDGLQEASETAVLNANYLLARLREKGIAEHLPLAYDRICSHEFVLSGAPMKKNLGLKTLDLAKRLLDHGFHPPTVYFPLLVDEALLVEPTETETKETLDAFADAIAEHPARGRRGPGDRPQRALLDAGAPARRGRRRQAPGHPPAALGWRRVRLGLALLVVFLAAASPAAADSILFVRDGNVWISTPDGTTERPLTSDGGYASPSMADDGTIVALRGGTFVRLRADGARVGMPVDAIPDDWMVASGPHDARVSPDGSKVAYWFTGRRRFCLPVEPTCPVQDSDFAAYAYAGRVTDPLELGPLSGRRQPSWYGSGRALAFRRDGGSGEAVTVNRVGRGDADNQGWFSYDDGTELAQGQLSRAGDRLAAVAGGNQIHLFGVTQPPPRCPRCAASCRAGRSPTRPGRPTARCSPGRPPTASTSPARCRTCASRCATARSSASGGWRRAATRTGAPPACPARPPARLPPARPPPASPGPPPAR